MDDVNEGSARASKHQRLNPSSGNVDDADAGDGRREADSGNAVEDGGCDIIGDGQRDRDSEDAVESVARITKKIRSGMECCSVSTGVEPTIDVSLNDGLKTVHDLATHFTTQLWTQASKVTKDAKEKSWIYRYLACCYALFWTSTDNTEMHLMDQRHESTGGKKLAENHWGIDRWRSTTYMANLIVDGLSKRWQWKAGLVYHAIAGNYPNPILYRLSNGAIAKNYRFGKCAKMSREKQQEIAALVVEQLSDCEPPDGQIQRPLLHPAHLISETLHVE